MQFQLSLICLLFFSILYYFFLHVLFLRISFKALSCIFGANIPASAISFSIPIPNSRSHFLPTRLLSRSSTFQLLSLSFQLYSSLSSLSIGFFYSLFFYRVRPLACNFSFSLSPLSAFYTSFLDFHIPSSLPSRFLFFPFILHRLSLPIGYMQFQRSLCQNLPSLLHPRFRSELHPFRSPDSTPLHSPDSAARDLTFFTRSEEQYYTRS